MSKQANVLWIIFASVATGILLTMAGYSAMEWYVGNPLVDPNKKDAFRAGVSWAWIVFGLAGQFAFTMRFLIQWFSSEKAGKVVVPKAFWFLSLAGSAILLVYFLRRGDPVGVIGQSFGFIVYIRNLMIGAKKSEG
jgi:lipid-A-disaccharide synthase-like uncharacterized protein